MADKKGMTNTESSSGADRNEEALREVHYRRSLEDRGISLSSVLDSIQDGISILDGNLTIVMVNKAVETWYAHKVPFLGRKCYEVYHGRSEPCEFCPTIRSLESGRPDFEVVPLVGADGKNGWLELFTFPMANEETGEVDYIIEYVRDVTKNRLNEQLLKESEKKHRALLDAIPDMIFLLDRRGVFLDFKPSDSIRPIAEPEQFIGANIRDVMPPDVAGKSMLHLESVFESGEPQTFDYSLLVEGHPRQYEARLVLSSDEEAIAIIRDITERKEAEDRVRESEERFRSVVTGSPIVFFRLDSDGIFTLSEGKGLEALDLRPGQVVGRSVFAVYRDNLDIIDNISQALRGESVRFVANVGDLWYDTAVAPVLDDNGDVRGVSGIANDISDLKKAEERLLISLKEKEVLLQEVHHRVKNNLQVITSLLTLQAAQVEDEVVGALFNESKDRIRSMAFVHEELYRSRDMSKVDMEAYLKNLSRSLYRSYGVSPDRIDLKYNVENVAIGIDRAIPCGLILNELISNALKHAFPGDASGEVTVSMRKADDGTVVLEVADNGVGLPEGIDIRSGVSMGLRLLVTLAEMQLGGRIEVEREGGTRFHIVFRDSRQDA